MDFDLSEQQRMIVSLAQEFARREIQPAAARCDREARLDVRLR
jgi:alkylation response protein AidB-like acyl-CoA dehydrogenase